MSEEPQDYVRYALRSAGFTPTDKIVEQIYAAAVDAAIALGGHPYTIVDTIVTVLHTYYPTTKSLEFIESMQQLQTQAGQTQEELSAIRQSILDMAAVEPEAKPKQRMPYYQKDKAHWWKGRRPE